MERGGGGWAWCRTTWYVLELFWFKAKKHTPSWVEFLDAFTKLWKSSISFVMPVCLYVRPSAWNKSDVFSWKLICKGILFRKKNFRQNSSPIKMWQELNNFNNNQLNNNPLNNNQLNNNLLNNNQLNKCILVYILKNLTRIE